MNWPAVDRERVEGVPEHGLPVEVEPERGIPVQQLEQVIERIGVEVEQALQHVPGTRNAFAERKDDLMNAWEVAALTLTGASAVAQGISMALETASGGSFSLFSERNSGSNRLA